MPRFIANRLVILGGNAGNSQRVWLVASRKVGGVTITTVPAVHSNRTFGSMISAELGELFNTAGLTTYADPPTGYVLTFSNGLSVYLSGDIGVTAEQDTIERQLYKV